MNHKERKTQANELFSMQDIYHLVIVYDILLEPLSAERT